MLIRFAYLAVTNAFTVRHLGGKQVRFTPADRTFLAARLTSLPCATTRRLQLLVSPDTVLRWHRDRIGLLLADLIIRIPLPENASITLAVDDTLFKRSGKKVLGAFWHHDGAAKGPDRSATATAGSSPASTCTCHSCPGPYAYRFSPARGPLILQRPLS